MDNSRVFKMSFASVYPHYVAKAEKKGRTKDELHTIIHWLTGYDEKALNQVIDKKVDFATFFAQAPRLNPNVAKITGVIPLWRDRSCGYRVEDIEDPLMQKVRYLDKPACRPLGSYPNEKGARGELSLPPGWKT